MDSARVVPRIVAATLFALVCSAAGGVAAESLLRLDDAIARALEARSELAAATAEARALEAAERQAALPPNPELTLEVEDVAGTGEFGGVSEAQTTLRLIQPIELGGDRRARRMLASAHRGLASFDAEANRLDVIAETQAAFVSLLVAQEAVRHATEFTQLASRELHATRERVRFGAVLAVEETRARYAEESARLQEASSRLALDAARQDLAAMWGDDVPDFDRAEGDLERVSSPPPLADLVARLDRNPDLARFAVEQEERRARIDLARANRVPDPQIGAGVRHLAGPDDATFVFQIGMPLPVFDRQQGAVAEAAARAAKLDAERATARRHARIALAREHARWRSAHGEIAAFRERLLPDARRVVDEVDAAHRAGRVSQLEVFVAVRNELETKNRLLEQLGEAHAARIATERLVGGALP